MLRTYLTEEWGLAYPIIGAPMHGSAGGVMARAITLAGGLGTIGVGSTSTTDYIAEESARARGEDNIRFGLGLMIWAVEQRPELLDAAIAERPFLISLSFGSPAAYTARVRSAGIVVATQVNTVAAAREAEASGVDLVVAQGSEAGGHHMGKVGTLTLLQGVLDAVDAPVLAAGGIGSPRGLTAVLAAGAQGAWVGTAFLASTESNSRAEARRRIIEAPETETVHTSLFDRVQRIPWPPEYPGRALRNQFTGAWHDRLEEIGDRDDVRREYEQARAVGDYDTAAIYAGQSVGLVRSERPAGDVVQELGEGAEDILRRVGQLIVPP